MTPKEKAEDLYKKYLPLVQRWDDFNAVSIKKENAIKSSLIAVDEILNILNIWSALHLEKSSQLIFWEEVKQEIEKL